MGVFETRESFKFDCKEVKKHIEKMVLEHKRKNDAKSLNVDAITGKIKIIRCSLLWSLDTSVGYQKDRYLKALKYQYEDNVDVQAFLDLLDEIENWLKYRNEINHALFNKNINSVKENLLSKTERGMELARSVDNFVSAVKKRNYIRKSIDLKV